MTSSFEPTKNTSSNQNDDISPAAPSASLQRLLSRIQSFLQRTTRLPISIITYPYPGYGTPSSPYIITYLPANQNDQHNAQNFPRWQKSTITILQSLSTFAVTFASSVYASGIDGVTTFFRVSQEVATLGISLVVLGFAVGPLIWAPLSEVYGRKRIFVVGFTGYVVFSVGAVCAQDIAALLVLRFLASAFGASSMTNVGGVIADMYCEEERGLAMALFIMAPFLGPALGKSMP
jgi:hypothetical protein